jgi:mitotic spindle assembly checkpoint protein MAD2
MLDGNCTFNVLVYADADSDVPLEWGDSDAKEIQNGEKVQLRSFSTSNHRVDTLVSYRCVATAWLFKYCGKANNSRLAD